MLQQNSPLIQAAELLQLRERSELVLIDASNGPAVKKKVYQKAHLEGAKHVDLNTELATILPDVAVGGRHPLPSPAKFAALLTQFGPSIPSTHVVIYDNSNAANAAARLWWMLRAIGHAKVQVVDGGMQAAVAGFPVSSEVPEVARNRPLPCCRMEFALGRHRGNRPHCTRSFRTL